MNVDVILFDLDGTLIDTVGAISKSFNKILDTCKHSTYDKKEYYNFIGKGFTVVYDRINELEKIELDKESFLDAVREDYKKNFYDGAEVYDGIYELLDELKEKKVDICVVTNKDHDLAVDHVNYFFSKYNFKYVYGLSTTGEYKSKPDPYLVNLISKDYEKNKMLFVGDMQVDIDMAKNSGIDLVYCTWGYGHEKAENMIEYPKQLLEYL